MSRDPAGLLTAYADGQLDDAERLVVEAALAADADLRNQLEVIRSTQSALRDLPAAPAALRDAARERLLARVQHAWRRPRPVVSLTRRILPYAVAASMLLVIGAGLVMSGTVYFLAQQPESESEVPPVRVTSIPAASGRAEAQSKRDHVVLFGDGQVDVDQLARQDMASAISSLDQPLEQAAAAYESPVAKGREEAIADKETGSQSFFSAIGAGGGSSGGRRGLEERKRLFTANKMKTLDAKDAPATPPVVTGQVAIQPVKPNRPVQSRDGLLDFPSQAPGALANQLANIAPTPLLAADPAMRLRNLAEQYQLPLSLPSQRFTMEQALPTAPGLSAGEQVVMLANRAGAQVVLANGRITVQAPAVLDPTDRQGLDAQAFAAAWGTPPMAIVAQDARQTFALDADTASFDRARAELDAGRLPDPAGLRPEHFINAVPADYPRPVGQEAFALYAEAGPSLFARGPSASRQAQVAVGVVGRAAAAGERRPLHLVVALDTSGSMARSGALDRARIALYGLVDRLAESDRVAVIAFGERGRVVLPATPGNDARRLREALAAVDTAGATNTTEGLSLAIQVARELAAPGSTLRVVLVTDGAAIAGAEEAEARTRVGALRAAGGSLLVLSVGEQAADTRALDSLVVAGDGQQIHLGSDDDAHRVVDQALLPARLEVLARDAKAQVAWNPERVTHARLVGYEHRRLDHAAFRDDRVDAGELPSATVVTALFEVVLAEGGSGPLGTASVRYFDTRLESVRELACPMPGSILAPQASPRLRTLACAAELAEQLRGSWWANVRPTSFRSIAAACAGLPAPADLLASMANRAEGLRPLTEVHP